MKFSSRQSFSILSFGIRGNHDARMRRMKHNGKSRLILDRSLLTGILLSLFLRATGSFIHAYIFHEGTFAWPG